jgi:hypothetical protein
MGRKKRSSLWKKLNAMIDAIKKKTVRAKGAVITDAKTSSLA